VNAPRTWPNSSLSNTPSETPPEFTITIGRDARLDTACSARATTPLPVPFSPSTRTFASEGPTREITCSTPCIDGDSAMSFGIPSPRSSEFSASSRWPFRSAWLSSICVRMIASSRALSHGFWMKSRAPRRIASTATSTLPQAVMTTTGSVGSMP
jgi:hypothetical protein